MKSIMIGMLAETPVHVGAGQSSGFVDLPVAREAITSYPVIPSTGLKGSFREQFKDNADDLFGKGGDDGSAGNIIFSEGRLLLLPVRSLTSSYKWVTCPHILERLKRDIMRTSNHPELIDEIEKPEVQKGKAIGNISGDIFLEERQFKVNEHVVSDKIIDLLKMMIPNKDVASRLQEQLLILNDNDFKWFAQYGLAVNARNVLKKDTKTSENLWYEEVIPADSIFYTIAMERKPGMLEKIEDHILEKPYIQLGGNETVGQGWFNIHKVGR